MTPQEHKAHRLANGPATRYTNFIEKVLATNEVPIKVALPDISHDLLNLLHDHYYGLGWYTVTIFGPTPSIELSYHEPEEQTAT